MAWTTYVNPQSISRNRARRINLSSSSLSNMGYDSTNMLQSVYRGRQDRIQRYTIYDWMDQDSDVARALDLIAEHCVPKDPESGLFFWMDFESEEITSEENTVLKENLKYWIKINEFDRRLFEHVRATLKYGDWFYWRNPRTFKLWSLHPKLVQGALVNQADLEILGWITKGIKFNQEDMELVNQTSNYGALQSALGQMTQGEQDVHIIPAEHIIHLTLNEGKLAGLATDDDPNNPYSSRWPFGESILENMYKTFKQRELIEDASIIHRMQRAPTRRVWYIDVGRMRPDRIRWVINDFRNSMNEKRIPQVLGDGGRSVDSTYNPQSQLEDYYIPVTAEGRSSKVENIDGQSWRNVPELEYFTSKMMRALRVPYSMLLGPEEGGSIFNDAKVGTAYMQEIEFSKYCDRIQTKIEGCYDHEYKMFTKHSDIPVNVADFKVRFNPPTNYEEYLKNMRASDGIQVWGQLKDEGWISKRYLAMKLLGWNQDDILENEKMFVEENYPLGSGVANDAGLGGAFGGGGALPGPMGGTLPPPGDLMGGDLGAGDTTGGLGGAAGGLGTGSMAPGGGLGAGMGSVGAPAGGLGESVTTTKQTLFEDDFNLDSIQPVPPKSHTPGTYKKRTPNDQGAILTSDAIEEYPKVTLGMVRNLRRLHMQRRIENAKRLRVVQTIYRRPADAGTEGGGPPAI